MYKPNKQKGYYGATVAAPVFKEIARKIYYTTPKEVQVAQETLEGLSNPIEEDGALKDLKRIPNLKGMPAMEAIVLLEQMGLKVKLKGQGKVVSQSIRSGSKVKSNATIILELA